MSSDEPAMAIFYHAGAFPIVAIVVLCKSTTMSTRLYSARSFLALTFLVGGVSALIACGDSDSDSEGGSGGAGGEGTTTVATTTTKATTTTVTATTTTQTSTTSGMVDCSNPTEITADMWAHLQSDGTFGAYGAVPSPDGGAADPDRLQIEFYGPPDFDGDQTGMFDLAAAGDDNYATCSRCVRLIEDAGSGAGRIFFQLSGTMDVDPASTQLEGTLTATLTDVLLVEVTIEEGTFVSTPVAGGECLHLATADIAVVPPMPPAGWTCDAEFYADGFCDCGCGAFDDLDCADMTIDSCEYCDATGSCSTEECPGTIDPANTIGCTP